MAPSYLTQEWNLCILLSLLCAVVFGQVLSRDGYRSVFQIFPESGSFQFTMFLLGGVIQSWLNLFGVLLARDVTVPTVSVGLTLWVAGMITQAARWDDTLSTFSEQLQHYATSSYVETYLISLGGGLVFWGTLCNLFKLVFTQKVDRLEKRLLLTIFVVGFSAYGFFTAPLRMLEIGRGPDVYLVETFLTVFPTVMLVWYVVVPVYPGARDSGNQYSQRGQLDLSGNDASVVWFALVLHLIYVVLSACFFYLPYGFLGMYAKQHGFDPEEIMTVMLVFATGAILGALTSVWTVSLDRTGSFDFNRILLPLAVFVQVFVIMGWSTMVGKNVGGLNAVAFFVGFSTAASFLSALLRTTRSFSMVPFTVALLQAVHVALLLPGSSYLTSLMHYYINNQVMDFVDALYILSIWAWFAAILCIFSCAVV